MKISIHFSQAPKFGTYSIHQFMTNLKNNLNDPEAEFVELRDYLLTMLNCGK